jgi:hypothetical protein
MNEEADRECEGCNCSHKVGVGPVYYIIKEYHWDGHVRTLCRYCGSLREEGHDDLEKNYRNDVGIKFDTQTGMPINWWGNAPPQAHTHPVLKFWAKGWQRKMDDYMKTVGPYRQHWRKIIERLRKADYRTISTPTGPSVGDGTTNQTAIGAAQHGNKKEEQQSGG